MVDRTVSRRLLVTGGFCVGGAALLGVAEHETHGSEAHSTPSTPTSSTGRPTAPTTAATPTAPPTVSVPRTPAQLTAKLDAYRRVRGGTFGVALHDARGDQTFNYGASWRTEMFSAVKVLIVATALRRCQERGIALTSAQTADVHAAITRSDNRAASALLTWAGLGNVQRVARLYGLTDTVIRGGTEAGQPDWWGYSTTSADDMLTLLRGVVSGTSVITAANGRYLKSLMSQVIPAQRWGVCAPPLPTNLAWRTKNGWGRRDDGYHANSIGHITGNGRTYNAVILSRSPHRPVYTVERQYAFDTVNGISKILYDAMAAPLR